MCEDRQGASRTIVRCSQVPWELVNKLYLLRALAYTQRGQTIEKDCHAGTTKTETIVQLEDRPPQHNLTSLKRKMTWTRGSVPMCPCANYCVHNPHSRRFSDGQAHPQDLLSKLKYGGDTPHFNERPTHTPSEPSESSPDNTSRVPALLVTFASSFSASVAEELPVST